MILSYLQEGDLLISQDYGLASLSLLKNVKMCIRDSPGTMSPYQHGEVFVTADGAETDLDLGHYERFKARRLIPLPY